MSKYHFDIKQNTEEWHKMRLGRFTASGCADLLMAETTAGYKNLINRIFEERFTGEQCESIKFKGNGFTDRGHELEPVAIADYEMKSFNDVESVGFVSEGSWLGCSPDGLIGSNGLIQIKCPIFATQFKYLMIVKKNLGLSDNDMLKKIDSTYYKQMQFELNICKDREYNIFYSYHPKLKPIELRIEIDGDVQAHINDKIEVAKNQIDALTKEVCNG